MSSSELEFKPIRNAFIKGLLAFFVPVIIFGLIGEERLESEDLSSSVTFLIGCFALTSLILWVYSYIVCWRASYKYAIYKGYSGYLGGIAGLLNIFGISFLFLLDSKRQPETNDLEKDDFASFDPWSIVLSLLAISIVFYPVVILGAILGGISNVGILLENEDLTWLIHFPIQLIFLWYFYKKFVASKINWSWLFGSREKVNIFLPLSLAIADYFFSWGFNSFILYGISFIYPKYLEYLINQDQLLTVYGFVSLFISAVFFAPVWEEILCRGIFLQKIARRKTVAHGIFISSFIFAAYHFRYDIIPLFIFGITTALLYIKTRQLITPMLLHFFYNLIVVSRQIYYHYFVAATDVNTYSNVAEYQEHFFTHLHSRILFIAFSAPYLIYFIYKNFPRHNDISKLPYYVNKARATEN